jgi:hypothetical protein
MMLPGGLWNQKELRRDFAFRPLTGTVELRLAETTDAGSIPARVTAALAATLQHSGGRKPLLKTVAGLCVGDRQYMMRELAALLRRGQRWLSVPCRNCGNVFDFVLNDADLPVKEAGAGYPFIQVETGLGTCRFRVPTGADQEAIAGITDEAEALRALVTRCLVEPSHLEAAEERRFTAADVERIDAALEDVAPEVALSVQADCPACGVAHAVDADPYVVLAAMSSDELFKEIHILASAYHWSEAEIISMPVIRRRRYLELIDRGRVRTLRT